VDSDAKTIFHGSSNINTRSALHDYELDVLVKSPVVYKEIKQILEFDIHSSKPLDHTDVDGNILDKLVNELTVYFS
jgi:phosphatidylserine/phosphatidylglycerophosphate/cardiolipin synthase-like enzyme